MMDDDKKPTSADEEFHFSEAEESETAYAEAAAAAAPKPKISRRNVLIAIGIIIVALSLYKLLDIFFGGDTSKKQVRTIATVTKTEPVSKPVTETQPITQQKLTLTQPKPSAEVNQRLDQLQEHSLQSKEQLNGVVNSLSDLSASMANLQNTLNAINQQLQGISVQLQQQQVTIRALKARPKPRVRRTIAISPPLPPRVRWYVQAIIPGRAWLVNSNGETLTVSTGSRLSGYGRIRAISVTKGIVRTSSGAIIRYRGL